MTDPAPDDEPVAVPELEPERNGCPLGAVVHVSSLYSIFIFRWGRRE